MFLNKHFDTSRLSIRYRASAREQNIRVSLQLNRAPDLATPIGVSGPLAILCLRNAGVFGMIGGSEFPPADCAATLVSGPTLSEASISSVGETTEWVLSVAGMSPKAVRVLVSDMSAIAADYEVKRLSVEGSFEPDGSELSVTTDELRRWLEDSVNYPGPYPDVPFDFKLTNVSRDGFLRVRLASGATRESAESLEALVGVWKGFVSTYPNRTKEQFGDFLTSSARSKTEVLFRLHKFDYLREPVQAPLVNGLIAYHQRVAPIASVEFGYS